MPTTARIEWGMLSEVNRGETFGSTNTLRLRLLFGRALGRVLAHEVYHIELNTPLRSSKGIAKPVFAASDLFAPGFGFAPAEMEQMTELLAAGH